MSRSAVLRILARFEGARCLHPAHHLSRRRPSLSKAGEPSRSNGSDGRLVRQILEKLGFTGLNRVNASLARAARSVQIWFTFVPVRRLLVDIGETASSLFIARS